MRSTNEDALCERRNSGLGSGLVEQEASQRETQCGSQRSRTWGVVRDRFAGNDAHRHGDSFFGGVLDE